MTLDDPLNLNTAHPANRQARLGYAYETLDATHDVSVSSTAGTRFVIPGTTDARSILSAGLGVNVSVAKATTASLRYAPVFPTGNLSAQSIQAGLQYTFYNAGTFQDRKRDCTGKRGA